MKVIKVKWNHKGEALSDRISVQIWRDPRELCWAQGEGSSLSPGGEPVQETDSAWLKVISCCLDHLV